jgi:CheY-like chemotaxis protein
MPPCFTHLPSARTGADGSLPPGPATFQATDLLEWGELKQAGEKATAYGPLLIVDDDPDMVKLAAHALRSLGIPILEASSGPRALALALMEKPRLVLLDVMLPGMHGFEVCRALKDAPETRDIPVVLCSAAYSDWRVREDAKKTFGADAFIAKPFRLDVLGNTVRDLLNRPPEPARGA